MPHIQTVSMVFDGVAAPFRPLRRAFDTADLGEGEALVRIDLATICGSDLHTVAGTRPEKTPCVLGHEAVGRVIAADDEFAIAVGERVTWSVADSCGSCHACTTHGLPQKCERLFKYGHAPLEEIRLNGCYASHIVLRRGTHVARIGDEISDAIAVPANCALATMVHAVEGLRDADTVLIQGGGLLGLYGCALLRERGVAKVYCTEIDPTRFELIEALGGHPIDARNGATVVDQIRTDAGGNVDAAFEVAGAKELVSQGVDLLRAGGFYGLVGLVHPDSDLDVTAEALIRKCITLRGVHNYAPRHLDAAVSFLQRNHGTLPLSDLVSSPFELARLDAALDAARSREHVRVAVRCESVAAG